MQNRLEMLRIYCAAVEAGSFKEAATRLGTSPRQSRVRFRRRKRWSGKSSSTGIPDVCASPKPGRLLRIGHAIWCSRWTS